MTKATIAESGAVNFTLSAGETFRVGFNCKDEDQVAFDLTGYTARGAVRRSHNDEALFLMNSGNGMVTIPTPADGKVVLHIPDETTESMSGVYFYGLKLESGGGDELEFNGTITFGPKLVD